jgi:hypothetical protein
MLRQWIFKSPFLLAFTVITFTLIMLPLEGFSRPASRGGSLVGFIYGSDMKTPIHDAVVKMRNVDDGREYVSSATDATGAYKIEQLGEGNYVLGVSAPEGDYNFNHIIRIKEGEIGKLSLALKSEDVSGLIEGTPDNDSEKPSFFYTPVGIAVLMVATTVVLYGVFKLMEEKEEASPSRR